MPRLVQAWLLGHSVTDFIRACWASLYCDPFKQTVPDGGGGVGVVSWHNKSDVQDEYHRADSELLPSRFQARWSLGLSLTTRFVRASA